MFDDLLVRCQECGLEFVPPVDALRDLEVDDALSDMTWLCVWCSEVMEESES